MSKKKMWVKAAMMLAFIIVVMNVSTNTSNIDTINRSSETISNVNKDVVEYCEFVHPKDRKKEYELPVQVRRQSSRKNDFSKIDVETEWLDVKNKSDCESMNSGAYYNDLYTWYDGGGGATNFQDYARIQVRKKEGATEEILFNPLSDDGDDKFRLDKGNYRNNNDLKPYITISSFSETIEVGTEFDFNESVDVSCFDPNADTDLSVNYATKKYYSPVDVDILIKCTNKSNATLYSEFVFKLYVRDTLGPSIDGSVYTEDKPLEVGYVTKETLTEDIRKNVNDNSINCDTEASCEDGRKTITINIIGNLVLDVLGSHTAPVILIDANGNESEYNVVYWLADTEAPIVIDKTASIAVRDRGSGDMSDDDLASYLFEHLEIQEYSAAGPEISIVDNGGFDVKIVREYAVVIDVYDLSGNRNTTTIIVAVYDDVPPEVAPADSELVTFEVNESNFSNIDWRKYIIYNDNYTLSDELSITHDAYVVAKFDLKDHCFTVTYTVTDSSGNASTTQVLFKVVKTKLPTIEVTREIHVEYKESPNIDTNDALECVNIEDNYYSLEDGTLVFEYVIDADYRFDKIGVYTITYYVYSDIGSNSAVGNIDVSDTEPPTVTVTRNDYIFVKGIEKYDFVKDLEISDNSETFVYYIQDGEKKEELEIDYNSIGIYTFIIVISDTSDNEAEVPITAEIINLVGGIYGDSNVSLNYNEDYTDLGAFVMTESGEDISSEIKVVTNLSTDLGEYHYVYYVVVEEQVVIVGTRTITVVDKVKPVIKIYSNELFVTSISEITAYLAQIEVVDNYDGVSYGVEVLGKIPEVDGELTVFATDSSGNVSFEAINVIYEKGETDDDASSLPIIPIVMGAVAVVGSAGIGIALIRRRI